MSVMSYGPAGPHSPSQSSASWSAWAARTATAVGVATQPVLRLVMKVIAEYHTRAAVRQLQELDDRLLHDIGLTRGTINQAVRRGRELELVPFAVEWTLWSVPDAPQIFKRHD